MKPPTASDHDPPTKTIRLDKWLKIARIYKTRSGAAKACQEGQVKLNGERAKPAKTVHIGDEIVVKHRRRYRTLEVLDVATRSIPAREAALLYSEHKIEIPEEKLEMIRMMREAEKKHKRKFKGRPTKKERRDMGDPWEDGMG